MIRINLNHIFPYLELLEPLVRCNLDGSKSTKDALKLRRSLKIYDDLDDGLTADMMTNSISFGEELNLNTEGDARFVTFLFRNVKEFMEEQIEGIDMDKERKLKEDKNKDKKDDKVTDKIAVSMSQRRLTETNIDKGFVQKVNREMGKKFSEKKLISHISSRI